MRLVFAANAASRPQWVANRALKNESRDILLF
jgi:hypothetical protein